MDISIIVSVLGKKGLDIAIDEVKDLFKRPEIVRAFSSACESAAKEIDYDVEHLKSLYPQSLQIPLDQRIDNQLKKYTKENNIPNEDILYEIFMTSWQERKEILESEGGGNKFFSLSEDEAKPIINELAKYFFQELTQIKELVFPHLVQKLDGISDILNFQPPFPTDIVDKYINKELDKLRKSRFFAEFNRIEFSLTLAQRIIEGDLARGTNAIKCRTLAWCARCLSRPEDYYKAEEILAHAIKLDSCQEINIAKAFISSYKGDRSNALSYLSSLDTPMSNSAALMIVGNHEGPQGAIDWINKAGMTAKDLDSDGKYFLLSQYIKISQWKTAIECCETLDDDDFIEAPVLNHIVATILLISTVPDEFRGVVLDQVPFEVKDFPLASDIKAIEIRRKACSLFIRAVTAARELNFPKTAMIDEEYALWLVLRDPDEFEKGMQNLNEKLNDAKTVLRFVNFGIRFGVKMNLEAIEKEIERQIAWHGEITYDACIARFALCFTQKSPEDIANYINKHRHHLEKYLDKKMLGFLEIDALSQAGLPQRANERLNILIKSGLSETEIIKIQSIIVEAAGTHQLETLKQLFKTSDKLGDLICLVEELEKKSDWDGLCEFGRILFERTHSLKDAIRLTNALNETQQYGKIVGFLESNKDFLVQSIDLHMLYSWSLYYEGKLLEAQTELAKMNNDRNDPNYRALQFNLGITMGDWTNLIPFIVKECQETEKRSAQELMNGAQLAFHLCLPNAKDLLFAAANKGNDDPNILASAYFLAIKAGWENDDKVFQWLQKAIKLSGDDGPIQKMSLKDIMERRPNWDRRTAEILRQLSCGDIPMCIAAESLNKSIIDFILFPALANLEELDPRRRNIIPVYSGARPTITFDLKGSIGFDSTALLTLSFLGMLDEVLDSFDRVYVPHTTLAWLFSEKQKVTFNQPSRIRDAHHILHLISTVALEKLKPSTVPNSDLSDQIGDNLALLIAEAQITHDDNQPQRLVVRSNPVHRTNSLMMEEADLAEHSTVLSSCQAIVDKLQRKGLITSMEEQRARNYLQLNEKPWPNQPDVNDGAILYLDDLTVSYFLHLGILEKLHAAGFKPFITIKEIADANKLVSYENLSHQANDVIEHIRSAVHSRIVSGKIKCGKLYNTDKSERHSISGHPTVESLKLARDCEAIIIDDRYMNQLSNIDNDGKLTPILSTLDLLDALTTAGKISPENFADNRTKLRKAGYIFIPISEDELSHHLELSAIKGDKVVENAELKAIREYILRIRMSTFLQLPKEAHWLHSMLTTYVQILKGLWKEGADFISVRVRSNWILDQIDVRGWAHCFGGENGDNFIKIRRGAYILSLISPLPDVPQEVKGEYWKWLEEKVLAPTKEQYPELYSWMIAWQKEQIAAIIDMDLNEGDQND